MAPPRTDAKPLVIVESPAKARTIAAIVYSSRRGSGLNLAADTSQPVAERVLR